MLLLNMFKVNNKYNIATTSQLTLTCSNSIIETLGKSVKYVQSYKKTPEQPQ